MNNEFIRYGLSGFLLLGMEFLYFKIAERFRIIDKPNERSSHVVPTIRGGGIIFLLASVLWFVMNGFHYPWFMFGLCMISAISFLDDLGEQPARLRLSIQLLAFILVGWQVGLDAQSYWISLIMLIIGVGTINAFNFMDGINGITGVYSLVNLVTFYCINERMIHFVDNDLLLIMILSVCIFLFFNFRTKARCFAGDVGSVTIAFIQIFLLLQLILATNNYGWIFLFLIYGVDSVVTIVYRLSQKENIFKAHRKHLFQYFSNELNISHLWISILYGVLQAIVNILLFLFLLKSSVWFSLTIAATMGVAYILVREIVLKKIGSKGLIIR